MCPPSHLVNKTQTCKRSSILHAASLKFVRIANQRTLCMIIACPSITIMISIAVTAFIITIEQHMRVAKCSSDIPNGCGIATITWYLYAHCDAINSCTNYIFMYLRTPLCHNQISICLQACIMQPRTINGRPPFTSNNNGTLLDTTLVAHASISYYHDVL